MGLDNLLVETGEFPKYQIIIFILLCLLEIFVGFHALSGVFLGYVPKYRCLLDDEDADFEGFQLTKDDLRKHIWWGNSVGNYSNCYYLDDSNKTQLCKKFVFDKSIIDESLVTQFELVCTRIYLTPAIHSSFMIGFMFGSIIFGSVSDRYGRKFSLNLAVALMTSFGLLTSLFSDIFSFLVSRIFVGACAAGVCLVAYCLGMELCGPSKRFIAGTITHMFFVAGYILLGCIAYYFRTWRSLHIAITIPMAVFSIYWWILPESVQWYLSQNDLKLAVETMMEAMRFNKINVTKEEVMAALKEEIDDRYSHTRLSKQEHFWHVYKYPTLRKRALILCLGWIANSMTYYGLSWISGSLSENVYMTYLISGVIEIPAYMFVLFKINKWGRKLINCGGLILTGLVLIIKAAIPHSMVMLNLAVTQVGKMFITASFDAVFIVTAEIFPTVIRSSGIGAGSTAGKLGAIAAPYINAVGIVYWHEVPYLVYGGVCVIAGIFSLWIPESMNKKLPVTLEDGEIFGKQE